MSVMYVDICYTPFKRDDSDNKLAVLIATSEGVKEVEPNSAEENVFWRNLQQAESSPKKKLITWL